jgi:hypothetical protein
MSFEQVAAAPEEMEIRERVKTEFSRFVMACDEKTETNNKKNLLRYLKDFHGEVNESKRRDVIMTHLDKVKGKLSGDYRGALDFFIKFLNKNPDGELTSCPFSLPTDMIEKFEKARKEEWSMCAIS